MTTTIDFNNFGAGTVVDNQFIGDGVTISATGGSGDAMIFDTSNPTGNDGDLATGNLGNVLIISEDGDSSDPDDNASGGTFKIEFDTVSTVKSLTFLDIEENGSITLYDANGDVIDTITVGTTGNSGQVVIDIDVAGVASMDVHLNGSGAIDDLVFDAAPASDGPDYIVEGTSDGELIDGDYTGDPEGDLIDAGDNQTGTDDDSVRAGGGDDTVKAGAGDDTVSGGDGDDFILGDTDNAQDGDDLLMGDDGDDTLCGLNGEDTLDGGAGDDLLEGMQGDDLLLGGSGDDVGYGDSGDDTIYGDSGTQDDGSVRESFEWDLAPNTSGDSFIQDTGNTTVTFTATNVDAGATDNISTDTQLVDGIETDGTDADATSSLDSVTNGNGNEANYELGFADPVENVSFRVNDIDGDGIVTITAFDADGNEIEVQLSGGSELTLIDTDAVAGVDTADSNGGYMDDDAPEYSLLVTIPGPVSRITIDHTQDGGANSGINITDVFFDVPGATAVEGAGDDSLYGGTGEDLIFGEDGDDLLSGGTGDDTLEGGDGADDISGGNDRDLIVGGNDGDVVDGGTGSTAAGDVDDVDTMDLTGEGPFRVVGETTDADGNSTSGTIEFLDGAGDPTGDTMTFTEIEVIIGDQVFPNENPDAMNDTVNVDEDGEITFNPLDNDSDPDGGTPVVTDITAPSNGKLTVNGDGTYTYEPNDDYNGPDSVTYTISDGQGGTDTGTITFNVAPVNDDPDAVDDANSTEFETTVSIDLLANDTDVEGDTLTVDSATSPDGTLVETAPGVYDFTPADGFEGTATVSYTVSDGNGGSDSAVHTIEVGADPTPQDGIVDGEESGEVMELGYDDANLPTDNGGDIITNDADEIEGNGGDDTIDGAGGDDTIDGGTGDDVIAGGTGTNELTGGAGDDTFVGGDGADSFQGNNGQDNLDYSDSDEAVNVDLSTGVLSGGDADNDTIIGGIDGVIGSEFDDTLTGFDQSGTSPTDTFTNELFGEGGDDTISGLGGDDLLDGGDDNDLVDGGAGNDSITGGDGSDTLSGGEGDDTIDGGNDDDNIVVGAGDTATGGSGDDVFTVDPSLTGDSPITIVGGETGEDLTDPTNGGDGDTLDLRGLDLVSLVFDPADPTFDPVTGAGESGTAVFNNDAGDPVTITFSEIEIVVHDPLPDGVVNGEEDGEDMQPNYDDGLQTTDNGGDFIDGPDGDDDIIEGNGGDDTINAGQGSDTVSGGTGDDSIIGGASDDGDDLSGDEGDDTILGGGGGDTIDGGAGDDDIEGGTGDDTITGGDGNDSVVGGNGDDVIDTSGTAPATDLDTPTIPGLLVGGPGDMSPDDDLDTVDGGAGNDSITTGDDADVITGGTGDDTIDGGIDADTIDGGADDDSIIGGEGSDSILGGGGEDTIYGGLGEGSPDVLNVADDGFNSPIGDDPVDNNGDDFIDGGAGNDLIFGQDDNDTILGGTGDDTIDGGVDDDSILGGQGEDVIEGGHGQDFIQGNNDDDVISGGRGSDTLEGNAGDDTIIGGAGDSIIGGGDADSIVIDQNEVDQFGDNDTAIFADGSGNGDDNDTLDLTDFVAHRNLTETDDGDVANPSTSGSVEVQNDDGEWVEVTFAEIENLLLPPQAPDLVVDGEETGEVMDPLYDDAGQTTDGGGDIIDGADGDDDSIRGNGGDDSINAGAGDDTVDGGDDNDTVNGQTGDDLLDGGDGDDLVTGGFGDDTVFGGEGDDELRGNIGDDSLDGGDGNDSMGGAEGDDTLQGGEGEDTLTGGSGDDVLDGGADDDTINGSSGNDTIEDLDGDNLIDSGIDGLPDLGVPFVPGTFDEDADPNDDRDSVTTGDGNDTISTGDDADTIDAGNGDNVIDAGFDADEITSGSGDDSIIGGEGSDTINSGDGDDTIQGGIGTDAANLIDDNVNPANNDDILDNGDDLINAGAGNDVVNGEDDNDTIDGGAGDDTLDGGIDDDTVLGGTGDDVIVGGQGADSLDGGEGDDTFNVGTFTDPVFGDDYLEGLGDTVVGGEDPDDNDIDVLDLTGGGSLEVVYDDAIDPTGTPGESGTVIFYTDDTQTEVAGTLEFKEIENVIPCFTPGAMIATPRGEVPVETLRAGDKVITRDNGIQEICWTGNRTLNRQELSEGQGMKPILVKAGSLGRNLPERDMLVSPQHRVLITGETPQLYFEESEVLVAAKHLVGKAGVSIMDTMRTTYIHFMFEQHEVVLSDGAWTESFQPGDQTMGSMGEATRDEIFALFPELATAEGLTDYAAARRTLKAHEAKLLRN